MIKKLSLFIFLFLFLVISPAFAANFTINDYFVDIKVNEDKTMNITETIDVNFTSYQHGIYRDIPLSGTLKRTDGENSSYTAYVTDVIVNDNYTKNYTNNFLRLKIGSSNNTIIGRKKYIIKYKYYMGKDPVKGADEFYFNIIGNGWTTKIRNVNYSIKMPKEFDRKNVYFYLPTERKSNYYFIKDNTIHGRYYSTLYPKQALTIKINLPDKYFIEPPFKFSIYMLIFIIPLSILLLSAGLWLIFGKDRKTIEVVNFKPPEGMNPVEVAYIYSQQVSGNALSSLIFYLASKGYIKITTSDGYDPNSIFSNVNMKNVEFELIKPYDGDNPIENVVISTVFSRSTKISIFEMATNISLRTLSTEINTEMKKGTTLFIKSSLLLQRFIYVLMAASYISSCVLFCIYINLIPIVIHLIAFPLAGYFAFIKPFIKNIITGKKSNINLLIFGFLWCSFSFFMLGLFAFTAIKASGAHFAGLYFIIGLACTLLTEVFATYMPRWTYKGQSVYGQILGFRNFLKRVKLREMKHYINNDPQYFYSILPYALVLELSDKWIEKFIPILDNPPSYYDNGNFNSKDFSRAVRNINSLTAISFIPLTSGSHSSLSFGGSGGGSSGGGGGGGGGGSW